MIRSGWGALDLEVDEVVEGRVVEEEEEGAGGGSG